MLSIDALLASAVHEAGTDDFGPDGWQDGLAALVASANDEAHLNATGELTLTVQITKSLVNRAGVTSWRRAAPEIGARGIERPVFILGLPRCGTTLLSYLLDRDPLNRSLLRGECLSSTPPPQQETLRTDPRIAAAQAEMDALYAVLPEFKAIHYEEGAGPTECITVLGQEFRSVHYETLAHLPSYGHWHEECDMRPAYRWHHDVLQVLQWRAPGRWVLKSPCHNLALPALADVYPDARFIVPHRDPATAVSSLAHLVSVLAGLGTDVDRDAYLGDRWLHLAGRMLDGLVSFRDEQGDDRFFDLAYRDLTADALGVVGELYDWLGWELTPTAVDAMQAYLAEARPGRFGRHDYTPDRFGLGDERVTERVATYVSRFGPYL